MPTAGSIIANVRVLFGDPDRDWLTDAVGLDFLNRAERRFVNNVEPLDEIKDYVVVSKQSRYDLPTNCIIPTGAMWYQNRVTKLKYESPDVWSQMEEAFPNSTGTPDFYSVIRRQMVVGPNVPTTASSNSTASGLMYSSTTTLSLVAASGTFRTKGFAKVNSEVFEYTGVASSTLTGVTRGVHGTTAASHASGDTVTQIDIQLGYRKSPGVMSATSSTPEIPETYHDYLEKYILYLSWLARGDNEKAQIAYAEFASYEESAGKNVGRRSRDGMMKIQDKRNRWFAGW